MKVQRTVIGKGTEIKGQIISRDDIEIRGVILGDVKALCTAEDNETKASTIHLQSGYMQGNIINVRNLNIDCESVIEGDIDADRVIINGKVTGNICVDNLIVIQENAQIKGILNATSVIMRKGAKLKGIINT